MEKSSNVNPDMFELLNMTKHMVMSIKQQIGKSPWISVKNNIFQNIKYNTKQLVNTIQHG